MNKKILYLDMDEVLVDFHSHPTSIVCRKSYNDPQIFKEGYFRKLKPLPYSLEAVDILLKNKKLDVYILTQGLAGSEYCYKEKVEWIKEYLPELVNKIIITCDKSLHIGDFLIDDNSKWSTFEGKFIEFTPENLLGICPLNLSILNLTPEVYELMWLEVLTLIDKELSDECKTNKKQIDCRDY